MDILIFTHLFKLYIITMHVSQDHWYYHRDQITDTLDTIQVCIIMIADIVFACTCIVDARTS